MSTREQALEKALRDIADSDDVDNALDPARNKRVAQAALSLPADDLPARMAEFNEEIADAMETLDYWANGLDAFGQIAGGHALRHVRALITEYEGRRDDR